MILIPKILSKTKYVRKIQDYMKEGFDEVLHTTLNPDGPGCVRIHLVPPKYDDSILSQSIAIINGTDIIPINYIWSILLSFLIREINGYDGREICDADIDNIFENASDNAKKVITFVSKKKIRSDIETIYNTIIEIAYGKQVTSDIKYMNIGEYSDFMNAPHRMDIMVSAMTKNGKWHCNQKCIHCYAAGQVCSDEPELSTSEWKIVLDKCRQAGIPQITFTGGEPTMRDDLFDLISYSKWFITRLNTNGIKLTKEYCENLKKSELDSVQITFYSSDPDTHNRLVGAEQFENTANGIRNALEAGLNVSVNTPLCILNRNYLSTLKYLHDIGIIYVTCSGLITTGNALNDDSKNLQLTNEDLKEVLRSAVEYCNSVGMEIAFTSPSWVDETFCRELGLNVPSCGACLSNMAITPSGNVVPCQSWLSDAPLGNMLKDEWGCIWNCDMAKSIRNNSAEMNGKCPLRRWR